MAQGEGAQEGDQLVAVLRAFDFLVPEQVIKVPKLSFRRGYVKNVRILPFEHQTAEQLVEVPTVVSFSSLERTAEQSIDIPGTGRRRGGGGGLQGLLPGHSSAASVGEQIADIPVPHGLPDFPPGQGSGASSQVLALRMGLLMVFFALFPQ